MIRADAQSRDVVSGFSRTISPQSGAAGRAGDDGHLAGQGLPRFLHSLGHGGFSVSALRTGQLHSSWDLSREFGFTDVEGRRPDWGRLKIDFGKRWSELLEYIRIGNALEIQWLRPSRSDRRASQSSCRSSRRERRRSRRLARRVRANVVSGDDRGERTACDRIAERFPCHHSAFLLQAAARELAPLW